MAGPPACRRWTRACWTWAATTGRTDRAASGRLPAALPAIFTGLRLGLGLALVTLVVVEFITAKSGLGHLVYCHWRMLSMPEMYAAFALVGALGLVLTRGLRAVQARVLTW
jgi:ABC-type nitrate/sulfonate/bicarbonate transport system permease component